MFNEPSQGAQDAHCEDIEIPECHESHFNLRPPKQAALYPHLDSPQLRQVKQPSI